MTKLNNIFVKYEWIYGIEIQYPGKWNMGRSIFKVEGPKFIILL